MEDVRLSGVVSWFRRARPRVAAPTVSPRSEAIEVARVELVDLAPTPERYLGQTAYLTLVLFENLGRAVRVSRGVKSGVLSVNSHSSVRYTTPFGGMKASGLGRELGPDAAEHFTETKNVFYATGDA